MAWLGSFFGGAGGGSGGNEFVGQLVELGKQKLRIKKVIAEGGYGFVFVAQDVATSREYALKRLMAGEDATSKLIVKEVSFLRKLRGHPNIVQYIGAAAGEETKGHGMKEYLILTELCSGQLIDLIKSNGGRPLAVDQVLKIFAQVCRAVIHMHKQTPPIIHRDLKIENLLFSAKGVIKLCDFGSATTEAIYPDDSWTALQRNLAEDEIQRNTTPMYRAPEMIDLYSNFAVTTKADVWALGCILYLLCFSTHPFEDSAKLKIMNANYTIPEDDTIFPEFHHLICSMLKVIPDERANVEDIHAELVSLAADRSVDLKGPIVESSGSVMSTESELTPVIGSNYGSSVLLGNVVNRAGALFSNIKDVSSKVMNTMAGYAKSDMDISYITSRLLVMSFPADGIEGTYKNNIDDVRLFMDSKHPEGYVVINVSQRNYRTAKLNDRVYDCGWNPKRSPSLEKLVSLCRKLNNFLKQNKKNVVVVHCLDGRVASSLLLCSFFLFCKLFTKLSMALQLFNIKRCPVDDPIVLSPSQKRYCNYVGEMVGSSRCMPHDNIVFLKSFSISPIPIFNKARTGCRPMVEIYENEKRVLNTAQEIDQMREYHVEDGKIVFQTHIRLHGDITILVHHGRSTLGGKVQGKLTSINIFTLQFHTGFLDKESPVAIFPISELDIQEPGDKYPSNFGVCLNIKFTEETPEKECTMPWEKMHVAKLSPYVCFSSREEYWILHEEYGLSEEKTPISNQKVASLSSEPENSPTFNADNDDVKTENLLFDLAQNDQSSNEMPIPVTSSEPLLFESIHHDAMPAIPVSISQSNVIQVPIPQTHITQLPIHESDTSVHKGNQQTADLIDISTSSDNTTHLDNNLIGNDFTAFAETPFPEEDDSRQQNPGIPVNQLIDPFESLAATRTNNGNQLNDEINKDCLVDLDLSPHAHVTKSTSFTSGFDLINSVNQSTASAKQFGPDILRQDSSSLKKNRSLDNLSIDDIFGKTDDISIGISINKPKQSTDPFLKHFHNSPRKSNSESNLLGEWGEEVSGETLTPEVHHASSSCSIDKTASYDPLSEFGNLHNTNTFGAKEFTKPVVSTFQTNRVASPTGFTQSKPHISPNYNVFITPTDAGVFTGKATNSSKPSGGWAPKPVNHDEFSDILGAQGFVKASFGEPQKSSLKQLRDIQDDQINVDPVKKKIRDWSDGKGRNIRALLTSLHTVLWESEDKWQPIGIHQIMQGNQVKAYYRKACLAIHPDKHVGEPHEELSRAIFIELNEAWSIFEESGSLSLV